MLRQPGMVGGSVLRRRSPALIARHVAVVALTLAAVGCGGAPPSAARTLVRVNQVGFSASGHKIALLMSNGDLRHAAFTVVDAAGRVAFRGRVGRARGGWSGRWPHVYAVDFGRLARAGSYRVVFRGIRSPSFRIAGAAPLYGRLAADALAFLQAQRDGPDVVPGALRRAPSHLLDAQATVYATPRYRGL